MKKHFLPLSMPLLASSTVALAAAPNAPIGPQLQTQYFRLTELRLAHVSYFQSGGNCYSAMASWVPSYQIAPALAVRLNAGVSAIKSRIGKIGPLSEVTGMISYSLNPSVSLEGGGGLQMFFTNGGTRPLFAGNGVYHFSEPLYYVKNVFVGYGAALIPTNPTHELRVGIGTDF